MDYVKKILLFVCLISNPAFAKLEYDPWSPPLGEEVGGFTLSEGWEKPKLLPEPVNLPDSAGGWTDSLALSSDGKTLIFSYSRYDFSTFIASGGMKWVQTGPARTTDMTDDIFRMFSAKVENGKWVVSYLPIPSAADEHIASPALSPDSNTILYNVSKANPYRTEILSTSLVKNQWSVGKSLPPTVNPQPLCETGNPSISGNINGSKLLFIETKRKDPEAKECSEKPVIYQFNITANGTYSAPIRLDSVNGKNENDKDTQPHIMPDGSQLYWSGIRHNEGIYGIYVADNVNGEYVNPRPIIRISDYNPPLTGKPVLIGEPNVAKVKQGLIMYFSCGFALDEKAEKRNLKICFSRKSN